MRLLHFPIRQNSRCQEAHRRHEGEGQAEPSRLAFGPTLPAQLDFALRRRECRPSACDSPASPLHRAPPDRRLRSRCARHGFALVALLAAASAHANSQGSPICEVESLPLVPMSPTLANPAPQGWTLDAPSRFYPGHAVEMRLRHPDPQRRARGVLIWAKSGQFAGAGSFVVPANGRWAQIPPPANCGGWALSHADNQPKALGELVFHWVGSTEPGALLRAFIIEDCSNPAGCRDQQALTPFVFIEAGLFGDGFESASTSRAGTSR